MNKCKVLVLAPALALASLLQLAAAAVVVQRTRLIIEPGEREGAVVVSALPRTPSLTQVWLTAADGADVDHFSVMPALSLIKAGDSQNIRVIYQGEGVAADRETLLRLNIQDAAPTRSELQGQNAVSSTLLQVIKVFYRPQALRGQDPLGAPLRLRWTIKERKGRDYVLRLENPGPFHIVFAGLALLGRDDKGAELVASDSEFQVLDPMASVDVLLRASGIDAPVRQLVFSTVNDFGMTEVFSGDVVNGAIAGVERVRAVSSRPAEPGPSGTDPAVPPSAPPRPPASTARAALG